MRYDSQGESPCSNYARTVSVVTKICSRIQQKPLFALSSAHSATIVPPTSYTAYARIVAGNWSEDLFDHRKNSGSIPLRQNGSSRQRGVYGLAMMYRPEAASYGELLSNRIPESGADVVATRAATVS